MKELSITLTDKERETLIHALLIARFTHNDSVESTGVNQYYHIEESARIDCIIDKIVERDLKP